jgi:drug/metabolite transporter (DMT)-like permease
MEIQTRKEFGFGLMAMGVTLLIWASFFISLRASSQSALTIGDIALLRFLPAALVFGWLTLPKAKKIQQTPKRYLLAIALGAGLPFLLLAANGLRYAPVADGASLIPGILPLFVTSIAAVCYRERISSMRKAGIMLIFLGICLFLATSLLNGSSQIATGHALLLMASFSWAWFTIAMRVSGLTPIEGGAVLSLSACICLPVLYLLGLVDFNLLNAPSSEIAFHFMIQGIAAGLIANFTFGYAISRLGAEMSAALGSFTPVLAALIAVPMFAESLNMNTILAMMLIVLGAISASEIITTKKVAVKMG